MSTTPVPAEIPTLIEINSDMALVFGDIPNTLQSQLTPIVTTQSSDSSRFIHSFLPTLAAGIPLVSEIAQFHDKAQLVKLAPETLEALKHFSPVKDSLGQNLGILSDSTGAIRHHIRWLPASKMGLAGLGSSIGPQLAIFYVVYQVAQFSRKIDSTLEKLEEITEEHYHENIRKLEIALEETQRNMQLAQDKNYVDQIVYGAMKPLVTEVKNLRGYFEEKLEGHLAHTSDQKKLREYVLKHQQHIVTDAYYAFLAVDILLKVRALIAGHSLSLHGTTVENDNHIKNFFEKDFPEYYDKKKHIRDRAEKIRINLERSCLIAKSEKSRVKISRAKTDYNGEIAQKLKEIIEQFNPGYQSPCLDTTDVLEILSAEHNTATELVAHSIPIEEQLCGISEVKVDVLKNNKHILALTNKAVYFFALPGTSSKATIPVETIRYVRLLDQNDGPKLSIITPTQDYHLSFAKDLQQRESIAQLSTMLAAQMHIPEEEKTLALTPAPTSHEKDFTMLPRISARNSSVGSS